jgi:hypothetical protein
VGLRPHHYLSLSTVSWHRRRPRGLNPRASTRQCGAEPGTRARQPSKAFAPDWPGPVTQTTRGFSLFNAALTVFLARPIAREICEIDIPSDRRSRRISAQSSTSNARFLPCSVRARVSGKLVNSQLPRADQYFVAVHTTTPGFRVCIREGGVNGAHPGQTRWQVVAAVLRSFSAVLMLR